MDFISEEATTKGAFFIDEVSSQGFVYGGERETSDSELAPTELSSSIVFGWSWAPMRWHWNVVFELVCAILGIAGNLLVILVIFAGRSRRHFSSTDILIGNLAIADFLTSIFLIPYPMAMTVPINWMGWLYCKVLFANYLMWSSINASIYSLVAVCFDRFFAVLYPIHFKHLFTRKRVVIVISAIWVGSALVSSVGFFTNFIDGRLGRCARSISHEGLLTLGVITSLVRLIIPTLTMLVTQTAIIRTLHREASNFKSLSVTTSKRSFHKIARNRTIKLMFTVIIIYIVSWAPDQIVFLLFTLGIIPRSYTFTPLYRFLLVIAFCNSCANPIIYTLRHPRFRSAAKDFLTGASGKKSPIFAEEMSRTDPTSQINTVS